MSADLFVKDARVLTLDPDGTEHARASIAIADGVITAIGPDLPEPDSPKAGGTETRVIDARGLLAMPGLINGHFHSPGNFTKGAVPNLPLELFMLYEVPPLMTDPVSDRFAYIRTLLGAAEMLKQGVTGVHDDAFFLPIPTHGEVDSVMRAYVDSGMRAAVTLDQPNVVEYDKYPFLEGLLPEDVRARMRAAPRMTDAELHEAYQWFIATWHGAAAGRVGAAVSCSAPQRVTPEHLQQLDALSAEHDIPYNMHILETRLQRVLGQERLGRSLVRYVHDMGVLTERAMVIHSIWVDAEDIALMAQSGCSIAHNPVSNLKLGSGVMPWRRIRDAGINICLGTDEANVDDGVNLWSTVKLAGLIHNIGTPDYTQWPQPLELLRAATAGGAVAMRRGGRTGVLGPGYDADLILIDLDELPFVPLNDLPRQLVYCEPGWAVRTTIVAGAVVMQNGTPTGFDERQVKAEARELAAEFVGYMESCRAGVDELEPYYAEMYRRTLAQAVPMHRWTGPMIP
ncbi:MAG TPA: amidohydrolase family protein [Solirubrobacteraceae bacterium]|nr:amidohydrolase family protein [Solirubrobacteraceae bacterium]